jgi:hypothetical protein
LFDYIEERSEGDTLSLCYHLTPWDRPIFQANTAIISSIRIQVGMDFNVPETSRTFQAFYEWCKCNNVRLVSCRLPQDQLIECAFLESRGFRFIELNYRPTLIGLGGFCADAEISICSATPSDAAEVSSIAAQIFEAGRLHVDPQVGRALGDRRYAAWAANAFNHPAQHVLKCQMHGRTIGFMVVEQPTPTSRFWCLVGLAPGLGGQGLGRRVWQSALAYHHWEGVEKISTSISSHNVAVHNLCASLGFRFPAPSITLHWCPFGPVKAPA